MLQLLRKKAQSTFIQIIVVVIALVFIFWGVGTNLMNGSREAALVVNGEEVTFQQYQQAYEQAYQRLSDQFGGNMPKGIAEAFNLKQQVINQLIQAELLRQGAREMGIVVSDREISNYIEQMVQFQENGAFSMDKYKSLLAANRMAPTKFEKSMRTDRLSETAAREITNFSAVATSFEIGELYSQVNEKIDLQFFELKPEDLTGSVTIDDEALQKWFETAKDNYKTEPQRKVNYLTFVFKDVADKITIEEAKIEQYYQSHLDEFKVPEERHARHILLKAGSEDGEAVQQQKAEKAAEVLALAKEDGADFAALAMEYSEGPSQSSGGDLGYFTAGQMVPAFDQAVFSMQKGQVSDVVKTQFGYHIIYLEDIRPAHTKALAEVTPTITKTLQDKEAEAMAFQMANDAYEGIITAGSLQKYSVTHPEATITASDYFVKSNAPDVLQNDSSFLNAIFTLNKGELSSLVKGSSGYGIFFVEDVQEPEIPELATIRDTVENDFRLAKAKEMVKTRAEELLKSLQDGKAFAELAGENGYEVKQTGLIGRNNPQASGFPQELLESAFTLSTAAPLPEKPGNVGDNYYLYSLTSRDIPKMPESDEELARYKSQLLQYKKQMLLSGWLRHMQESSTITQHQSL